MIVLNLLLISSWVKELGLSHDRDCDVDDELGEAIGKDESAGVEDRCQGDVGLGQLSAVPAGHHRRSRSHHRRSRSDGAAAAAKAMHRRPAKARVQGSMTKASPVLAKPPCNAEDLSRSGYNTFRIDSENDNESL